MSETLAEVMTRVTKGWNEVKPDLLNSTKTIIKRPLYLRRENNLFVGYKVVTQTRLLLLRSVKKYAAEIRFPKNRDWFKASAEKYEDERPDELNLVLELTDPDYQDNFEALVACVVKDVFAVIEQERHYLFNKDKHQAEEFRKSIKKWYQENPETDEALGRKRQRGLHAELWFLREYVLPQLGPAATVKFWVGPFGYAHAFQFPSCGIEVKAVSPTEEDPAIQISNEDQLDCIRRGRDGAPLPSEYELRACHALS